MNIRLLNQEDWHSWKNLRLEALQKAPEAFGSSFEEESDWPDEKFKLSLKNSHIFGAFIDDQLIGCAGFYILDSLKGRHKGIFWGMYVKPKQRGSGVADSLVKTIITYAKPHIIQLHLTVVTTNQSAIKLYQKNGFRIYGTEPRSLKIGDQFYDEHLMVLKFDQP